MPDLASSLPSAITPRRGIRTALIAAGGALFVALAAVLAGFGWLDLLRTAGAFHLGPSVPDSLPLRRLAGESAQPLLRAVLAFASVGLAAGFALAGRSRPVRFALVFAAGLGLLAFASEATYAVQETQGVGRTISHRHPGIGILVEAFALAAAAAGPRLRRRRFS